LGSVAVVSSTCGPAAPLGLSKTESACESTLQRLVRTALLIAMIARVPELALADAPDGGSHQVHAKSAAKRRSKLRAGPRPTLSGRFFGYEGPTLHTWEFSTDGTFVHTVVSGPAESSSRSQERGTYAQWDDSLDLTVSTEAGVGTAGSDASPGSGLVLGGHADAKVPKRRVQMTYRLLGENGADGIVLDGTTLKPKSW
jgi:hypothetical protein